MEDIILPVLSHNILTMCPNGIPEGIPAEVYTEESAKSAVSLAEEVINFVKTKIKDF